MIPYLAITWIGLLVPASPTGLADEEPARKSGTDKEIRALVEQLASPNKAPNIDRPEAKYPRGYDNAAQARVLDARHRLKGLVLKAIPFRKKATTIGTASRRMMGPQMVIGLSVERV